MIVTGLKAAGNEVKIPKDGLTFCGNKGQDSHSRLKSEAGADVEPNTGIVERQPGHCRVDLERC